MQKTIYTCDHCSKPIGTNFHISLCVNKGLSGIAVPPNLKVDTFRGPVENWTVEGFTNGFVHLHPVCAGPFFSAMTHKVIKQYFPESFAKVKKTKIKK